MRSSTQPPRAPPEAQSQRDPPSTAALRSRARLGLREAYGAAIGDVEAPGLPVRMRQHVNPLRAKFQKLTPAPEWSSVYKDPKLPLVVDVGCGPGRFVLKLAEEDAEAATAEEEGPEVTGADATAARNFLGLEIREPIVERALQWSEKLGLDAHVHFMLANATVSIGELVASYPGEVSLVCVQFPDPHFKRRHRKRRIVNASFVDHLRRHMPAGAALFLQSDVHEVAEAMRDAFERDGEGAFALDDDEHGDAAERIRHGMIAPVVLDEEWIERRCGEDEQSFHKDGRTLFESAWRRVPGEAWLPENPLGVPTEREILASTSGLPVYRALLRRVQ